MVATRVASGLLSVYEKDPQPPDAVTKALPLAIHVGWTSSIVIVIGAGGPFIVTVAVSVQLVSLSVTFIVYVPSSRAVKSITPFVSFVPEKLEGPVIV